MGKKNGAKKVDRRTLFKLDRGKPSTGQSAPARDLRWDALTEGEQAIVEVLDGKGQGARSPRSIEYLSELFDGDSAKLQARNALRRIVVSGWVDRCERGSYQISERGRKRMART